MDTTFKILQIVFAILLIAAILLQQRGSGLGSAFGGEGNFYRSRRGAEKVLFIATIIIAVLFLASAIASVFTS
ncbi:MAG: preprotein translocase subunit SecG [bacterium ADurb.Bin400]|nr:MAG: preprotein translocase subunit SecG [bacterium ADurb.Bin400]